jgi:hypothetical protein
MLLRRTGFVATLAAGVGLLGASLHGITNVDHELQVAAATPATVSPEVVQERTRVRDCDKPGFRDRGHRHPEV